jgi:putative FmdB family regulatory protein
MPIYEYECQRCGVFEATQKITESPLQRCPTCKGKVKRLISNTSFQLKGTGWYLTDYGRKGSAPKESKTDGADSKGKAAPSDTSTSTSTSTKDSSDKKPKKDASSESTAT